MLCLPTSYINPTDKTQNSYVHYISSMEIWKKTFLMVEVQVTLGHGLLASLNLSNFNELKYAIITLR